VRVVTAAVENARDLADFVVASPSAYHAATEVARRLTQAGFVRLEEAEGWQRGGGGFLVIRDGAVVAWRIPSRAGPTTPFRIIGAHTDSPTFKLKPRPDLSSAGWQQLGMETYGSPLHNSWLDRELGLAGRLVRVDGGERLLRTEAIMRIPQLAIHLDRAVNEEGLKLDKQQHLTPVWSVGRRDLRILDRLADLAGCRVADVAGYDIVAFDTATPAVFGPNEEFLASGRLDNLSGVHSGLRALLESAESDAVQVLAAFDHEEVGSETRSGASGPLLADVLTRICLGLGAGPDHQRQAYARSYCLSVDAGHAVHPNYPSRHDPVNQPLLNAGPLLKVNANQRYATDARGAYVWDRACAAAGVSYQHFVSNNALPCGSTIGPLTATRLGIRTVDVGLPLLSMHSARELAGTADPLALTAALRAFFTAPTLP
jgi:aspartyl aminopeptidase